MIITQKFKKNIKKIIFSLSKKEIKSLIRRERLKFSHKEIVDYVEIIFQHSQTQKTFKSIYKNSHLKITYSVFMKNIALFSRLFSYLFQFINKKLSIKPSQLLNMINSSLIAEKNSYYITQKDWNLNRITTRIKFDEKIRICGSKILVFLNRFKQIYHAELIYINIPDMNILKETSKYKSQLKGIVLADKGFSHKIIRKRLSLDKNNIFDYGKAYCKLISPYRKSEKMNLNDKEKKLYKRRWKIETLFQNIKHHYSNHKLNLTGKYNQELKKAKFYSTLISYNLSTGKILFYKRLLINRLPSATYPLFSFNLTCD